MSMEQIGYMHMIYTCYNLLFPVLKQIKLVYIYAMLQMRFLMCKGAHHLRVLLVAQ